MQRYDFDHWMQSMVEENEGDYVLYTDHLAEIERLQARIRELEAKLKPVDVTAETIQRAQERFTQALKGEQ